MGIIGTVALLVFGPDQLPKVARKAGQVMRDLQNTSQSFIREMERAADAAEDHKPVTTYESSTATSTTPPHAFDETQTHEMLHMGEDDVADELPVAPVYVETFFSAAPAYHETPVPPSSHAG